LPDGQVESCAVIVHWGPTELTVTAALSLENSGAFSAIAVVANDGQKRPVELNASNVHWICPGRNLGFGSGCQFGADHIRASKYGFFNADVSMSPQALQRCLTALDQPNVGIVGPVLISPSGSLQSGCGTVSRFLWKPKALNDPRGSASEFVDCSWVTGAAIFCRDEIVRIIGWDGSYFLIYEDTDLCLRARTRGWRVVVVPGAIGTHPGGTTLRRNLGAFYAPRNRIWMTRRLGPARVIPFLVATQLLRIPKTALGDLVKRRTPLAKKQFAGVKAGLGPMPRDQPPGSDEPIS
jgi:GT2 family glycosyltransferase